jgi:acyl-CoA synthetase (AMP-forming)/AMP-acid ligase II
VRKSPPENAILEAWERTLGRRADAPAVFGADGAVRRTFAEIEAESRTFDRFPPGRVVAVEVGNSERWPAVLLALFRARCIPLPLGSHLEGAEREAALETARASAVVMLAADELVVLHRAASAVDWSGRAPDFLKLTSGTTSAPRAIRFRAEQLVADCEHICATMGLGERDLNYGAIPFSHSYGFSNLLTPLLCRGIPLVATEDRLPRALLAGLARTGATALPGMPLFYDKLAQLPDAPALPTLRLCISAGAPLPAVVAEKFTQRFGRRIHTFYGASECGGIGYDRAESGGYEDGFVGTPMEGVSIAGGSGEGAPITIRSAAVGDGYFPEEDAESLGGGCFSPADLIRMTPRGMFLAGRASDVINIAGRKLNPLEVEARLAELPGVRQAVVFGVRSATRGEEAVACVAGAGLTRESLLRQCRTRLSAWQVPHDVWIVPEIPVNERGKISRRALAAAFQAR